VIALVIVSATTAHADVRGTLRVGVEPLSLEPSQDTPVLGNYFDDAVTAYNVASQMYNRSHGFAPGSPKAASSIDRSALGLHETMLKLAPGIEMGGEHAMVRLEALVAFGENHRAIGVGLYPLDVAMPLRNGAVVPYIVAGGTASWLDRTDVDGEVGALVAARAAFGVRIARRLVIEAGYSFYALGGVLDTSKLHAMSTYDPMGSAPPPQADRVVSGGEQTGLLDISIGMSL
jgi:hypothetical protein